MRKVVLFTGQWVDMPFAELCKRAAAMGFEGLEVACGGDHLDVQRAADDPAYATAQRYTAAAHGLQIVAISNHLVGNSLTLLSVHPLPTEYTAHAAHRTRLAAHAAGQAVCDRIDARHRAILPARVWGDGDPEGVRQRAAEEMRLTARAAVNVGVTVVTGFTGSSIWHLAYSFPPVPPAWIDEGAVRRHATHHRPHVHLHQRG
jgi:sugar phosphate isomerase/epimerase